MKIELTTLSRIVQKEFGEFRPFSRKREYVVSRMVFSTIAYDFTDTSYKAIGDFFGGKNHATIINAIQRCNELYTTDEKFKNRYNSCLKAYIKEVELPVVIRDVIISNQDKIAEIVISELSTKTA